MPMTEDEVERQQVEWVFGLTGGELEDKPWVHYEYPEWAKDREVEPTCIACRYWYEGAPEYVESEYRKFWHVRTLLVTGGGYLPNPAKTLWDEDGEWTLRETFMNSGEVPCPERDGNKSEVKDEDCPLCEEKVGEEHGYIYVGDSYEAVYVRQENEEEDDEEA